MRQRSVRDAWRVGRARWAAPRVNLSFPREVKHWIFTINDMAKQGYVYVVFSSREPVYEMRDIASNLKKYRFKLLQRMS